MKLTGKELATVSKDCIAKGLGLSATAIKCGYFSVGPTGTKIPASTMFLKELVRAEGYEFPTSGRGVSSDFVSVMSNGTVMLSQTRCKAAGILPGDECEIIHNPTDGSFVIKKTK